MYVCIHIYIHTHTSYMRILVAEIRLLALCLSYKSYQSDKSKTFALIDENLTGLPILCEQFPEFRFSDVVW